jgi:hypothetical protein
LFPPTADNGSTPEEEELSDQVCLDMTDEYRKTHPGYTGPPVNIGHLAKGSKTWAQYAAVAKMAEFLEAVENDEAGGRKSTQVRCQKCVENVSAGAGAIL